MHSAIIYLCILRSGMLESGVDRIITQVVDPKMNHTFRPHIETAIHDFLSGDRKEESTSSLNSAPSEQTEPQEAPSASGPKTPWGVCLKPKAQRKVDSSSKMSSLSLSLSIQAHMLVSSGLHILYGCINLWKGAASDGWTMKRRKEEAVLCLQFNGLVRSVSLLLREAASGEGLQRWVVRCRRLSVDCYFFFGTGFFCLFGFFSNVHYFFFFFFFFLAILYFLNTEPIVHSLCLCLWYRHFPVLMFPVTFFYFYFLCLHTVCTHFW